jgi:predicted enzyme related to lactoylglutathione lyase
LHSIGPEEIKLDENGEREMPTIVHFEIPSDDTQRSKKFYNELFGWKIDKWSGPGTDNSTCSSTSTPNSQPIHKGSNLGSSMPNGNSTGH